MARIDAVLRPHDLTFARFEVLRLLAFTRSGGLPMGRLGALLQVHPASVTSAVRRLEAQGFVEQFQTTATAGARSPESWMPGGPGSNRRPPT